MTASARTAGEGGGVPHRSSLVSIVVPCYDQAQYLTECVGSVLRQTYDSWELIIVDDGSPDDCADVAARLAADHPRRAIRLIRRENGGVARARNAGISEARGAYVLPLDADDALEPLFLERTVTALDARPDVDFAYTDYRHFGASDIVVRCIDYAPGAVIAQCRFAYCTLYRKRVWEKIGGYNPNMAAGYEDWDFWIGAVQHRFWAVHIPETLFLYRVREGSRDMKARERDAVLKARIMVNHPDLYPPAMLAYAEKILSQSAAGGSQGKESPLRRLKLDLWLAYHAGDPVMMYRVIRNGLRELVRRSG